MVMAGVLDGTPTWFRRLVMPVVMTIVVVVPAVSAWLDMKSSVTMLRAEVADIIETYSSLENIFTEQQVMNDETHDEFTEAVQQFEVKQAVIDEKIDRILNIIDE